MAPSNEDTPPGYMYISIFILVMMLYRLNFIAAGLIELPAVYLTVPHGIWNYFFLAFNEIGLPSILENTSIKKI